MLDEHSGPFQAALIMEGIPALHLLFLLGGLEPWNLFFPIRLGMMIQSDELIFFRG
jgi:hypothetical protein